MREKILGKARLGLVMGFRLVSVRGVFTGDRHYELQYCPKKEKAASASVALAAFFLGPSG
jgi:hypothetical protein